MFSVFKRGLKTSMVLNAFKGEKNGKRQFCMITNTKIRNNPWPLRDNAKRTGSVVQSVKGLAPLARVLFLRLLR